MKQLLYAGIDWATKTHAVGVVDDHGGIRARFQVPNTGKGFGGLIRRLTKLGVAGVAIERPDGPLVEAMVEPPWVGWRPGRLVQATSSTSRLAW